MSTPSQNIELDPQNPYESYMVRASAGSGKTYQLAHRFLKLVATGVAPESILTLTFTQKAAQEMKHRILTYSQELRDHPHLAEPWEKKVKEYYHHSQAKYSLTRPPLSAYEVSQAIEQASPRLNISTIDSTFYQWIKRFTLESESSHLSEKIQIMESFQNKDIQEKAWQDLFCKPSHKTPTNHQICAHKLLRSLYSSELELPRIKAICQNLTHLTLMNPEASEGFSTSLGYLKKLFTTKLTTFSPHLTSSLHTPTPPWDASPSSLDIWNKKLTTAFFHTATPLLRGIISHLKNPAPFYSILEERNFETLKASGLFTLKGTISSNKIRAATRAKTPGLTQNIEDFEAILCDYYDLKIITKLMAKGNELIEIFELWKSQIYLRQKRKQLWSFDDITLAVKHLFSESSERGWQAFYQIQKPLRHLMIDELQDTNGAQWQVFQSVAEELVSASSEEGLPRTVFWVGDEKQCLYGFRQAHPLVMEQAQRWMEAREKAVISLDVNFRSHPHILAFINTVFQKTCPMAGYRDMYSAASAKKEAEKLPQSSVEILPLIMGGENIREEAQQLAHKVNSILQNPHHYPVGEENRPIEPQDITVLYRDGTHCLVFEEELHNYGIKTCREGDHRSSFYDSREIKDLMALLKWILEPSDILSLLQICQSPLIHLGDENLGIWTQKRKTGDLPPYLSQIKQGKLILKEYASHPCPAAEHAFDILEQFTSKKEPTPFAVRFLTLIDDLGVGECYKRIWGGEEGLRACQHIEIFKQCVAQWCYEEPCTPVELYNFFLARKTPPTSSSHQAKGVRLMSIHKAKGLEFPMVCLSQCASRWYKISNPWHTLIESSSESLAKLHFQLVPWALCSQEFLGGFVGEIKENLRDKYYSEAKRLLYVALSRASQYLVISGNLKKAPKKETTTPKKSSELDHQPLFYDLLHKGAQILKKNPSFSTTVHIYQKKQGEGYEHFITEFINPETSDPKPQESSHHNQAQEKHQECKGLYDEGRKIIRPHGSAKTSHPILYLPMIKHHNLVRGTIVQESYFDSLTEKDKRLRGIYIHYILERSCLNLKFSLPSEELKRSLCSVEHEKALRDDFWQRAIEEARLSFESITPLLEKAQRISCEVPLCGEDQQSRGLILGSADLLLDYEDHHKVIDWKSHFIFTEPLSRKKQKILSRYTDQLSLYKKCLQNEELPKDPKQQNSFTNKKVHTYIFLTSSQSLLEVSALENNHKHSNIRNT